MSGRGLGLAAQNYFQLSAEIKVTPLDFVSHKYLLLPGMPEFHACAPHTDELPATDRLLALFARVVFAAAVPPTPLPRKEACHG